MVKTTVVHAFRYEQHPYIIYIKRPHIYGNAPHGKYATNNYGFVGTYKTALKKKEGITRVICIGGSTTEMSYSYDPNNTYPGWVQMYLGDGFEVINAGCAGWTTAEMLINFELRLLDFKPDIIVLYAGYNDARRCGLIKGFKSDYSHARFNREFGEDAKKNSILHYVSPRNPEYVDEAPEEAIQAFKRNVKSMVGVAKTHGIDPIIVKFNYNEKYKKYVGLGDAIKRNMEAIKDLTPRFIEVPDIEESDFIDECHLNTSGMEKMGRAVASEIKHENIMHLVV